MIWGIAIGGGKIRTPWGGEAERLGSSELLERGEGVRLFGSAR